VQITCNFFVVLTGDRATALPKLKEASLSIGGANDADVLVATPAEGRNDIFRLRLDGLAVGTDYSVATSLEGTGARSGFLDCQNLGEG